MIESDISALLEVEEEREKVVYLVGVLAYLY
jgi:hypothetical protein